MRMTAGLRIWVAGALVAFAAVCVQAADLKTYKDVYQKESGQILQSFQPKFEGLQQQYQKSLEALKADAQSRGDLKKTMVALSEIERFQKAKSLPSTLDESAIHEIKSFQSAYTKQFSAWEMDMTAKLGALTVNYGQALDRLQKELTKTGKFDEALAVNQELEKAQAAIKGYAETLATLKGPAATNTTLVASSPTPAMAAKKTGVKSGLYLVVDLSHGMNAKEYPVSYLADVPKGGWDDEYKTDKLVLRRIEPGTFVMGSPEEELGHNGGENQHEVTLTQAFYIGVFEVTQKQWERVTGDWPSHFNNPRCRDERPVEKVSYNDVRGPNAGAEWPTSSKVDTTSFMGKLRARTGLMAFDLPTEAQWEYACRAGTTTALNSGKNLTALEADPNMAEVGRYKGNSANTDRSGDTGVGTAKVGSYESNKWGLYDMLGNVWEWCLDWRGNYPGSESEPRGATSGSNRIRRGGSWYNGAINCRGASRYGGTPDNSGKDFGFRAVLMLP